MLDIVRSLYKETSGSKVLEPLVKVAPTCVTLEKLYETLERCGTALSKEQTKDKPYFHSSLAFMLEGEMGDLFKPGPQTQNLTLFLNSGYDCKKKFEYETKRSGENRLTNLCVNFYGCCTPDWIERNLDASVIGNGWASRVLWIYGGEKRKLTTFYKFTEQQELYLEDIRKHFRAVAELYGEVKMTPECYEYFDRWYHRDCQIKINQDSKLDDYYARKKLHALKMAIQFHFAEKLSMVIELEDFKQSLKFLSFIELHMHKALASVNSNPTAKLATDMLRFITGKQEQGVTLAEIIGEMFGRSIRGMEAIDEAKEYLRVTEQIKQGVEGKWFVNKKIVPVEFLGREIKRNVSVEEIKEASYGK